VSDRTNRQVYARELKERGLTQGNKSNPESRKNREELARALPGNLNPRHLGSIVNLYGNQCPLTLRRDNLHVDHFIPTSWGHGGNYEGNLVPIHQSLNVGNTNKNPFEWVQQEWVMDSFQDLSRWVSLIKHLAEKNQMTEDEFIFIMFIGVSEISGRWNK
jgi:hypothetical protein